VTTHETFDVNLMGTISLLEGVRAGKRPCAVVLVSTDKCYQNIEADYAYRETDRLGGHDPYSASKAAMEIAAAS
jgi:CDP-glucose 4,6-dehydratase